MNRHAWLQKHPSPLTSGGEFHWFPEGRAAGDRELRAGDKYGSYAMGVYALDGNLPIPADAHDLRDAMGVVCVGLVDLKRQRGLCMTRIDADDRQLPCPSS